MADSRKRKSDADHLEITNKRIALAKEKYLPMMPHLLELPRHHRSIIVHDEAFQRQLRNESTHTFGFTPAEWEHMQYMTFVSVENRGVTTTRGAWEDDMARWGRSPAQIQEQEEARSRSSSSTPNPEGRQRPKTKMSIKDYAIFKKTGVRPPSLPTTASPTPDIQDASARTNGVSAQSLSTSLTQVIAEKTAEAKQEAKKDHAPNSSQPAGVGALRNTENISTQPSRNSAAQPPVNGTLKPSAQHRSIPNTNGTSNGITNGIPTSKSQEKSVSAAHTSEKPQPNGSKAVSKDTYTSNGQTSSAHHKSSSIDNKASSLQSHAGLTKTQPRPSTNGVAALKGIPYKESNKDVTRPAQQPSIQHALPKKPVSSLVGMGPEITKTSTPRSTNPLFQAPPGSKKRVSPPPSEDAQAEKRIKMDHKGPHSTSNHSRMPSNPQNPLPRKPDPSGLPPKPKTFSGPTSHPSPRPDVSSSAQLVNKEVRKIGTSKPGNSKTDTPRSDNPRSEMAKELPPLLSPLHANFESSPVTEPAASSTLSSFSKSKKQEDRPLSSKNTSDKGKAIARKQNQRSKSPEESTKNVSRRLPPLLSPDLPPAIEEALQKAEALKKPVQTGEDSQKKPFQTVEERHELARRENAPGVARKTVKTKTARKLATAEPAIPDEPVFTDEKRSYLTLKIRKASRTNAKRILNSRPQPGRGLTDSALPRAFILNTSDDSSDEDAPLAKTTIKKKRAADSVVSEPAAKRAKADNRDVARASTATSSARKSTPIPTVRKSTPLPGGRTGTPIPGARLDSPVSSTATNKNLLSTPKKGDAMKSVAMRKVDSSEGFARTPQPTMTSTPASIERSRTIATSEPRLPPNPEIEKLRSDANSSSILALKIKRKMDEILKLKTNPRPTLSEKDRKQGLATGLECLTVYMNSFFRTDRATIIAGHPRHYQPWKDISGLARFLEYECAEFPVLHALACQLGAICLDQLERSFLDIREPAKRAEYWDAMEKNNKNKNRLWEKVEENKSVLLPFSGGETLGPWSDIKDITTHTIGIITAFSRKEQSGWKKDPEFSSLLA